MQRRTFLSNLARTAGVATVAVTGAAAGASIAVGDYSKKQMRFMEKSLGDLKDQVDAMDKRQKKMAKAILIVASVSTGVDLVAFL
jgi:hypothetical protein